MRGFGKRERGKIRDTAILPKKPGNSCHRNRLQSNIEIDQAEKSIKAERTRGDERILKFRKETRNEINVKIVEVKVYDVERGCTVTTSERFQKIGERNVQIYLPRPSRQNKVSRKKSRESKSWKYYYDDGTTEDSDDDQLDSRLPTTKKPSERVRNQKDSETGAMDELQFGLDQAISHGEKASQHSVGSW